MVAKPMVDQPDVIEQMPRARSLVAQFEATVQRRGDAIAVNMKRDGRWQQMSWAELAARARDVADGLAAIGIARGDRVAIVGETQIEWIIADVGILGAGAVTVTVYQSNTPDDCRYILDDSGARFIFCDTEQQVAKIRSVRDRLPTLEGIIRAQGAAVDAFERTLDDLEALGRAWRKDHPAAHEERVAALGPEDAACIIYTSGTTGAPKGVVLTHGNFTYAAAAVARIDLVRPDDLALLFLPMAHSFAKVNTAAWLAIGYPAAFVESMEKLIDNVGEIRPTVMPSVPRIFEKVFEGVLAQARAAPGAQRRLFGLAMDGFDAWVAAREKGRGYTGWRYLLAKKVVFPKLAHGLSQRFGGRMRLFVSGGAPLAPRIAYFFEALGFTILEGYGLTETAALACINRPGRNRIGTVGPPYPGMQIRISDDGEIWLKGPSVMREYYRNPAATAEAIQDGWLRTGDIGIIDEGGCLRITDRKKDIIVTAGGKNIAPQNLENAVKASPYVSQVMVHGDQRRFLSALITLNDANVKRWIQENGIHVSGPLHDDPRVRRLIQEAVDAVNAKQAKYSTIKKFAIVPADFTLAGGELTPTLKVKRKIVTERYKDLLDSFYVDDIDRSRPRKAPTRSHRA